MRQTQPVKFDFDTAFGLKRASANAAPRARRSYSSDEVEAIRRETLAQGKAETEAQAAAARSAALSAIAQSVLRLLGERDADVSALRHDSAAVALQVGRKLAQAAVDAFPLNEVEALLADCLHKLHGEPRIVARVPQPYAEALRAEIDALCAEHSYAGRVIVLAEPSLSGADCHIEWANGGIERDLTSTFAAIEQGAERWRSATTSQEY